MSRRDEQVLQWSGYALAGLWIVSSVVSLKLHEFSALFWFCNLSVLVLALACFERSSLLLEFFLGMGLIFQTPWMIDWASYILFGYSFLHLADFYSGLPTYFMILTFIRHALTVPLVIVLFFFTRPYDFSRKYFFILLGIVGLVMSLSFIFPLSHNVNCVHRSCVPALADFFSGSLYSLLWSLFVIAVAAFAYFFIGRPLHKLLWNFNAPPLY